MKRKQELKKAFISAKSSSYEMLKVFTEMESCFTEEDLGVECLILANQLLKDGFPEKVILLGKRALKILLKNPSFNGFHHTCQEHISSLNLAFVLQLLGNACVDMELFDESLRYLNWANKTLMKIELDVNSLCDGKCVLHYLIQVECLLGKVKANMGCGEEFAVHLRNVVGIRERVMEEGCMEIGEGCKTLYEVYFAVGKFREALLFCLKALAIYEKHMGRESVEVGKMLKDLAGIYFKLGENEKGIEASKMSFMVIKRMICYSVELLDVELVEGELLIVIGRYEEALTILKRVVTCTPADAIERAEAFRFMGRAFCELGRFAVADIHLKSARKIYEQTEDTMFIAAAYVDMSRQYEKMNDFEMALSMLRTALAMPEVHLKTLAECATRLFSLVSLTEKEEELITCLEDFVEKLKRDFGPNHSKVGYSCARLGFAYMKLGQEELGEKLMADAKDIMNVSLGPHHLDSLIICQMLAVTYGTMQMYHLAVQLQEQVIEGLKGMGSSEHKFMDEAVRMLNRMKGKLAESLTKASFESKDGKDLTAKFSKCCISGGKVTK